ncbi:MAG: hypothetical protein ACRERC_14145 [Candidatus Binatia bacterium]
MHQMISSGLARRAATIAWSHTADATRATAQGGVYMEKKAVVDTSASRALRKTTARRRANSERDLEALLLAQYAARRTSVDGFDSVVWDEV